MEKGKKSVLLKAALAASFMTGAIAFVFAFMYTSEILCKVCFTLLVILSLLCAWGMTAADVSQMIFSRTSTKIFAVMLPFSANCGALATEILLLKEHDTAAVWAVVISVLIAVISAWVLVRRYMEDDF